MIFFRMERDTLAIDFILEMSPRTRTHPSYSIIR